MRPHTQAIRGNNLPRALGAGAVVKSAGKTVWSGSNKSGIIIEGANGSADAAAGIKQGVITNTWDPQADQMGLLSVELLAMKLKNQTPPKLVDIAQLAAASLPEK